MAGTALEPRAVDLRQASKIIGLSESLTRSLVQQGRLRSVRVGRRHCIALREIDRFLGAVADSHDRDSR